MTDQTKYMTVVEPVLEVSLIGWGKTAPWRPLLAAEGIKFPPGEEKIQIILSGVETRYMGVKFRELSISLRIDETSVFLVYAFNSNRWFALMERAFFRTPYYHAELAVSAHNIRLMNKGQRLVEATLPETASVTHTQDERNDWQIWLPKVLRKQANKPQYFNARLEGYTHHYEVKANQPTLFTETGLPASLQPLRETDFQVEDWLVRERARHSKSQTMTQE